jgi:PAS domain-containing protein
MSESSAQMADSAHHEELVNGLYNQMKSILDKSEQPIFIYLDDNHKLCNQQFAKFLGYQSPQDWAKISGFLEVYLNENSRETLMNAYWDAMNKMVGSTINLTWKKKDGTLVDSTMILVPMMFEGHLLAVHFITSSK